MSAFLFIGGEQDGRRIVIDDRRRINLPRIDLVAKSRSGANLNPFKKEDVYLRDKIVFDDGVDGRIRRIVFYRSEDLTSYEAINLLFDNYPERS
jgi:hypothetical protein